MTGALVEIRKVHKAYHRDKVEVPVLQGLDLQILDDEFVALMGPSGSGKTTLLNLLGGLDTPSSGQVIVGGLDLGTLNEAQRTSWRSRHVGFIFQMYHLVPVLTAAQNVELPLMLYDLSRADRRRRVATALEIVGLAERMDHRPGQLSGGQEQRVAIARAIVTDPDLILADEPTGDLDARSAEDIMQLLTVLQHEFCKTIVMVTHDPKAAGYARRQLHLEKGVLERDEHSSHVSGPVLTGTHT